MTVGEKKINNKFDIFNNIIFLYYYTIGGRQ